MKLPKLLQLAKDVLSDEQVREKNYKKNLKEIQRKLKHKAKKLKSKIDVESNLEEKQRMLRALEIVHAQRNKIIAVIKAMKTSKDDSDK